MPSRDRPPNLLLQTLDATDFDLLHPHLATTEMVRETILSKEGDPITHVYFPHAGAVSITVNLAEGQTIEVAMLGRDSVVGGGALADATALADAVVLFSGTASSLSLSAFRSIANRGAGGLRSLVLRHEQALLSQAQQSLLCNTLHPVEARLARCLLRARDLCDSETLPLTQEVLAQLIGVRRNAVSIVAHSLQRAGTIRYSRGHIEIMDWEALARTACDCYSTVKAQHERLLHVRS